MRILSFLLIGMAIAIPRTLGDETVEDAAEVARNLVTGSGIGTMATVFPADHPSLAGEPFSLQEYYASCHENGSLSLLFMPISRHSQNIMASASSSAAISITDPRPAASRPRISLIGNVTIFKDIARAPDSEAIQACYLTEHPDARWWVPGPRAPHIAYWARFDPHSIYYVGGFGDEHYIGYIPLELYQTAGRVPRQRGQSMAGRILVEQAHA